MLQLWTATEPPVAPVVARATNRRRERISREDAYKLLGLRKGCSKNDVIKAAAKLQKKIHPDLNRDVNTEELSKLVNEAKEKLLKELV